MMIEFNKQRREFLKLCEEGIRKNITALDREVPLEIPLGGRGLGGYHTITLKPEDLLYFETNKEYDDPSWFPARIKAGATALRNCGFAGSFMIADRDGVLSIRRV